MTKFVIAADSGKTIGLGLSADNRARLGAGVPILIDCTLFGIPGLQILLFGYGPEHEAMEVLGRMGFAPPEDPDRIHIDPKLGG